MRVAWAPKPTEPRQCACGCGKTTRLVGRVYQTWIKNHSRRKHHQDPKIAKKQSSRASHLRSAFGMTQVQYEEMLAEQGGCCAICFSDNPGKTRGNDQQWCVDHDHTTGKVRALLCRKCNAGLGHFKDNPTLLRYAADYVEKYK